MSDTQGILCILGVFGLLLFTPILWQFYAIVAFLVCSTVYYTSLCVYETYKYGW